MSSLIKSVFVTVCGLVLFAGFFRLLEPTLQQMGLKSPISVKLPGIDVPPEAYQSTYAAALIVTGVTVFLVLLAFHYVWKCKEHTGLSAKLKAARQVLDKAAATAG